ncbi:4-(cytidine 5'-diphospho)-2-C-methyl-D-erythritol kinase [Lysobacter pythonis]|uniref:4-diphosphocytidyl-2-C-methyl-D-erythritol kinase n=1 Tax=Solilutibacter pythonis TaxID=2483112 RepID=A0A3M2HUL3_9GAMM|nr:4-(cytidine 5'-diphospho)-2-C-methyl-D-erythritol kinase [Lysobacter pythonis]RMH89484.1 4-(cytidine 5'-diphospho)-2-C-methyl-D-erythritol kinase [Lysobacter pythonis]
MAPVNEAAFPASLGWSSWPAPAKLNLMLEITGRRADGYHTLQTVFRLLDWGEYVHLRPRDDGAIHRIGASAAGVAEAGDLAVRAARLLQSAANIRQGADIAIEKRIPAGGGFGGGSSDAATVLVALNHLWRLDWPLGRLAELGLALGADVPVFVHGRNAWAEGVGERISPVRLPPAWYVLAFPGVHIPTATLFQADDLTRDSSATTIADFLSGKRLGNAFEPVLRGREPAVDAALVALSGIGHARLTGSGSGCFVEFATREDAEAGLARLPAQLDARVAEGAARSPLLDALERAKTR